MTFGALDAEDDVTYGILVADWERKQDECGKCGRPRSVCSDPEVTYYPQRSICYADMEAAATRRMYDELHDEKTQKVFHDGHFGSWSAKFSMRTPFRYDDGTSIWMSTEDLTPDDNFLSGGA